MSNLDFSARVFTVNGAGTLKAYGTLIINGVVEVNGFRVIDGRNGLFVSPPQKKGTKPGDDGKFPYYDEVRFNEETSEDQRRGPVATAAFAAVLDAYKAKISSSGGQQRPEAGGQRPSTNGISEPPVW